MQDQKTTGLSGWLKRFLGIERTEEQLIPTGQTAETFCKAVASTATNARFEREPSQFFALLQDQAPETLKK